jgi:hypothetical protein
LGIRLVVSMVVVSGGGQKYDGCVPGDYHIEIAVRIRWYGRLDRKTFTCVVGRFHTEEDEEEVGIRLVCCS